MDALKVAQHHKKDKYHSHLQQTKHYPQLGLVPWLLQASRNYLIFLYERHLSPLSDDLLRLAISRQASLKSVTKSGQHSPSRFSVTNLTWAQLKLPNLHVIHFMPWALVVRIPQECEGGLTLITVAWSEMNFGSSKAMRQ